MLNPEDSKRVADRLIASIDRVTGRIIILLNEADDKLRRTNVQTALKDGVEFGILGSHLNDAIKQAIKESIHGKS